MIQSNINEIKTHLSGYLEKVARGETVIICKRNVPIAEIVSVHRAPHLLRYRALEVRRVRLRARSLAAAAPCKRLP